MRWCLDCERDPLLLRHRPVQLRHVGEQWRDVAAGEGGAPRTGLDLGDAQQCLEYRHDAIQIRGRPLDRATQFADRFGMRAASSRRARARVIGVRRSCAMALDTSRTPSISRAMRSSMSLIVSASWSNSSPRPVSRTRWVKSPAAIAAAVAETFASVRRNRLRTTSAPTEAIATHHEQRPQQRVGEQRAELGAQLYVASDQQAKAARQR